MSTETLLADIQELNLSYLLLSQKMLREDRTTALYRLSMSEPIADMLVSLSGKQLMQLARSNQLCFGLVFDDAEQLDRILNSQRDAGLQRIHAALLRASARPSTEMPS